VRPGGSVAIVETVLPEEPVPGHPGWLMDLNMLAVRGGRERTERAYATLLDRAGWRFERAVETRAPSNVVLASPA
jgi:O-methyltransferase